MIQVACKLLFIQAPSKYNYLILKKIACKYLTSKSVTTFKVNAKMSDLCPMSVPQGSNEDEYQPQTAAESHLLLLKQKKYCDVTFTFPHLPDRIAAHEIYLKARSPVFAKIFHIRKSGNVQGSEIEISESTPEIFQQFLEFIYADKLEVDIAGALDLLQLSQKYKVQPLTKKCEELLETEIPILDSVKVFETARRYGHRELMDRAGQIMVKSFLQLGKADALANAQEETLAYLLDQDDLSVKEVELFDIIMKWGKSQVGSSADEELLRNKLKNLTSKIRYTIMAPEEFTKVVVPTGLLSAEDSLSVYSYLLGDEVTRRGLKMKFNTTRRKFESKEMVKELVDFYADQEIRERWFPAFSKQCISFQADGTQVDGELPPDDFLKKTAISAINLQWPHVSYDYSLHHVLNFNVSIWEHPGPVTEGNGLIRFQNKLLNCKHYHNEKVSVEPPVELISGMTYSVIVENHSTSYLSDSFRTDSDAYWGFSYLDINRESHAELEDVCMTLKETHRETDFFAEKLPTGSEEFSVIEGIEIELM